MPETPIAFDGVTMLTSNGLGHMFKIGDKEVFVGSAVPMPGTAAFVVGQVGRLVLPRWFVEKNELQGGQGFTARRTTAGTEDGGSRSRPRPMTRPTPPDGCPPVSQEPTQERYWKQTGRSTKPVQSAPCSSRTKVACAPYSPI
jgi:hypothetical protein